MYIMTLGVLTAYRGFGLGSEMVELIIKTAEQRKEIVDLFLHVHVSNDLAINFYKRLGFEVVGRVSNYYRSLTPSDAFIVVRRCNRSAN